jgi:2',3'-cyclic-nucleotide 2'-phosphodiesterase (5'-nucleotidase family)
MKKQTTSNENEFEQFRLKLKRSNFTLKEPFFEFLQTSKSGEKKFIKIALNIIFVIFFTNYVQAQINLLQDYQNNNSTTIGTYQGIEFREAGFSGLFPIPNTNGKEFWTVSDRGVNIDAGNANLPSCRPTYDKIYAFPTYAPKIHRIKIQGDSIQILQTIAMKRPNGTFASGLINPTGFGSTAIEVPSTDTVQNCANFNLKTTTKDAFGIDSEGILVDNEGNFWICEEGGPTIWKVNPVGVVIKRFTPYANLFGAETIDVQIDTVFKYRKNNRGFEGISITPNGKIYAIIQSPILYPTKSIGEGTRVHRIIEIDPITNTTRMFAYLNDGIIGASGNDQIRLRDWKIGDMAAINDSTFLVMEAAKRGISDIKKIYLININNATNVNSGLYSGVTLEALVDATGLAANNITPVSKILFMDLLLNGWNPLLDKAEGLAIINDSTIAVGNDNDYGQISLLENGIATATTNKSHVVIYGLQGLNKVSGLQSVCEPSIVWFADADGDGFGNAASTLSACNQPLGYVSNATDCDDNNATITDRFTLQLLHASDFEASVSAVTDAPNFAALVDAFDTSYPNTLIISSGDNILPSPFSNAGEDPLLVTPLKDAYISYYGSNFANNDLRAGIARPDISIMNFLGVEAAVLGNHEFDLGTSELRNIIAGVISGTSIRWFGAQFPYLSSNLDFSADINLSNIVTNARLVNTAFKSNPTMTAAAIAATPKLAPSTIIIKNGQKIGLVGVTTPILTAISTPGATTVKNPGAGTDDMALLATIVQPYIDALRNEEGIEKIILLAHLQQLNLEKELATYLTGVDIIVSGGSHTLMADANDRMREDDVPAETYPFLTVGADGKPIAIVNTTSEYKYLGRLVVDFDCNNDIVPSSIDANVSGAYAADVQGVEEAWGGVYANAFTTGSKASLVKSLCDAVGAVIASKDGDIYGKASVYLEGRRNFVRTEETNLGNLSADANLWMAKYYDPSISISIKNGGGIRSAIGNVNAVGDQVTLEPTAANPLANKLQGDISRLDIENSLRFNNLLSALTLSATNLKAILEHGVAVSGPGQTQGRFPQISGVRFSYDETLLAGSRILNAVIEDSSGNVIDTLIVNGSVVGDPARIFRIVTLNFLAGGGDGYPFNTLGTSRVDLNTLPEQGPALAAFTLAGSEQDAFAEYMKNFHSVNPFSIAETPASSDKRIQEISDRDDCILSSTATIFGSATIESGMSASLTVVFTGNSPWTYSYTDGLNIFGPFTELNDSVNIIVNPTITTTYRMSSLEAGACEVIINGEAIINVTQIQQLLVNFNGSLPSTCGGNNGLLIVNVVGGTPPYQYMWSNGSTSNSICNLFPGTYSVNIIDADSNTIIEDTTIVNTKFISVATATEKVSCNGLSDGVACVTDVIGGKLPLSYLWNSNPIQTTECAGNLPKGFYSILISDADGCSITKSGVRIVQPAPLVVGTATGITNAIATTQGGTRPYTFLWSNGKTTRAVGRLKNGTYTVIITDANGCSDTAVAVIDGAPINGNAKVYTETTEDMVDNFSVLNVFPNPTNNIVSILFVTSTEQNYIVKIIDITGKTVFTKSGFGFEGDNITDFNFDNLARGIYAVNVETKDSVYSSRVIVK